MTSPDQPAVHTDEEPIPAVFIDVEDGEREPSSRSSLGGSALHFELGDLIRPVGRGVHAEFGTPGERVDTQQEVTALELRSRAKDFTANWLAPDSESGETKATFTGVLNNQFADRMTNDLLAPDVEEAWTQFGALTAENSPITMTPEEFTALHTELHGYLASQGQSAAEEAEKRLAYTGDISWSDRYQFKTKERRSVEQIKQNGLRIGLSPDAVHEIKNAAKETDSTYVPILEKLKNTRLAEIGGFRGSKISLLIHDYVDHFWTMDLLERNGVMDRHRELFDKIGNPEKTDIFKREGEAIASISFGVRYFETIDDDFTPVVDTEKIASTMRSYAEQGMLGPNQQEALDIVSELEPDSQEYKSLGFVFSNYITELDEQRRKFGKIKTKNLETDEIEGELDPMGPEYLSFFIETHHELLNQGNNYQDTLFQVHVYVEDMLQRVAREAPNDREEAGEVGFVISPDLLDNYDYANVEVNGQAIEWMRKNYGFMATKAMASTT